MNLLSMFKGQNPAKSAMPYLNQVPGVAQQQLNPYIQQGQQAGNQAQGVYSEMTGNPSDFYNKLMGNYSLSKGYQHKLDQGSRALRGSAAAGGFAGTPRHQQEQGELLNRIMSQGEGEYMDRIMQILGGGLQGQENAMTRGYGANNSLTDILTGNLQERGNLAFKGQQDSNATRQAWLQKLMQLVGAGAGFAFGGPAGAVMGGNIGGGHPMGGSNSGGGSNPATFGGGPIRNN